MWKISLLLVFIAFIFSCNESHNEQSKRIFKDTSLSNYTLGAKINASQISQRFSYDESCSCYLNQYIISKGGNLISCVEVAHLSKEKKLDSLVVSLSTDFISYNDSLSKVKCIESIADSLYYSSGRTERQTRKKGYLLKRYIWK